MAGETNPLLQTSIVQEEAFDDELRQGQGFPVEGIIEPDEVAIHADREG